MTIILTGFEPFPGVAINPSQTIVEALNGKIAGIVTEVLPTAFIPAGERIRALIREHQPAAVIALGVASKRSAINLERFALNINDAGIPDNAGQVAEGQPIVAGAPAAYRSTLALETMFAVLAEQDIPVAYSNHAGTYVCNHVMYCALHEIDIEGMDTRAGFIHVPMMREAEDHVGAEHGLPLATMIDAVQACVSAQEVHKP